MSSIGKLWNNTLETEVFKGSSLLPIDWLMVFEGGITGPPPIL